MLKEVLYGRGSGLLEAKLLVIPEWGVLKEKKAIILRIVFPFPVAYKSKLLTPQEMKKPPNLGFGGLFLFCRGSGI